MVRKAVIDIGTNSVKLLVADVDGRKAIPIIEKAIQTRLGSSYFATGRLAASAIETTLDAVECLVGEAKRLSATEIKIVCTGVLREANDARMLLERIETTVGVELEVVTPYREAYLAYLGARTMAGLDPDSPALVFDVGGGTTELAFGVREELLEWVSVDLGAVALSTKFEKEASDPLGPALLEKCRSEIRGILRDRGEKLFKAISERGFAEKGRLLGIGTGGTPTLLACVMLSLRSIDRERIESTQFEVGQIKALCDRVWGMPLKERQELVGLPPDRADIFPYGVAIVEGILFESGLETLRVSTRGLRFGVLMDSRF